MGGGGGCYSLCYQFPRRYTQAGTSRAGFLHTLCTNRASRRGSPSHRPPGLQDPEFSLRQSPPQPLLEEIKQKAHQKLPEWARKKLILKEGGLCSIHSHFQKQNHFYLVPNLTPWSRLELGLLPDMRGEFLDTLPIWLCPGTRMRGRGIKYSFHRLKHGKSKLKSKITTIKSLKKKQLGLST